MLGRLSFLLLASGLAIAMGGLVRAQEGPALRSADSFAGIQDPAARSLALFEEAGKVILHPRCVNCHPASERPRQGDDSHPHQPLVVRADAGLGAPGLQCGTCHGPANASLAGATLSSMPGNPKWQLAPATMAWEGKSLGDICRQIKDPSRNDGRDLAALHEHMAVDGLVGWAWNPGAGRTPAPGTQEGFGRLIKAWIETGAECPM